MVDTRRDLKNTSYARLARGEPGRVKRTYVLTEALVDRLNRIATELHVSQSDLLRYLLALGLDDIESGRLEVPTRPARFLAIDHDAGRR